MLDFPNMISFNVSLKLDFELIMKYNNFLLPVESGDTLGWFFFSILSSPPSSDHRKKTYKLCITKIVKERRKDCVEEGVSIVSSHYEEPERTRISNC